MSERPPSKILPVNQLAFERWVIEKICSKAGSTGSIVRQQYVQSTVVGRWGSGCGFYTDYQVPDQVKRISDGDFAKLSNVYFEVMGVGTDVSRTVDGFDMIMCNLSAWNDGRISCLECVNFGGDWPTGWYVWRERAKDG